MVGSGLIGHWLAKALRAADYGWKFGIILFAILASVVVVVRGWPPKLGVDLGGGSILVYKVDETKTVWRPDKMDSLLTSISKRVNPGGQKEISVKSLGNDMVEIVMPSVSGSTDEEKQVEADEIRKIIRTTGALEFRIVATKRDNESLIEMAKAERKKFPVDSAQDRRHYRSQDGERVGQVVSASAIKRSTRSRSDEAAHDGREIKVKDEQTARTMEKEVWEVLVLSPESEAYNVTGGDIRDARAGDRPGNGHARSRLLLQLGGRGEVRPLDRRARARRQFQVSTWRSCWTTYCKRPPTLQSAITDNGRITGNFTQQEVNEIVDIINAGSLPAALEPSRSAT